MGIGGTGGISATSTATVLSRVSWEVVISSGSRSTCILCMGSGLLSSTSIFADARDHENALQRFPIPDRELGCCWSFVAADFDRRLRLRLDWRAASGVGGEAVAVEEPPRLRRELEEPKIPITLRRVGAEMVEVDLRRRRRPRKLVLAVAGEGGSWVGGRG